MSEQAAAKAPTPKRRKRRILRILAIFTILLMVLLVVAPWVVARTGLRDQAINTVLASPSVTASSDSASFGWFSPLSVDGLHLKSTNNRVDIRMEAITADKSLVQLLSSAPDLGTVNVEKVHVRLELPLDVQLDRSSERLEPTFTANVKNASLTVLLAGQSEPVIDVDDLNMTFRVEKDGEGRVLTLDPIVIFDKRKLTGKLAGRLLHLLDPTIHDTPPISGAISLSLAKLRIPLGIPKDQAVKRIEMEGKLVFHDVLVDVKNPMQLALVRLVADLNGKHSTEVVRLAHNAEIRFQVRDGRLYHEGLRIGFPDIDPKLELASHGSIGLDKTLDLFVDLPRLDPIQRKEKGPAKCHITGTIAQPKIAVEDGSLVLRQHGHKDPIIAAAGIKMNMQLETTPSGHVLVVEPVQVFKNTKLHLGVATRLLKFLSPAVDIEREVTGEISLSFSKLRVPLEVGKDQALKHLEAEGKLTLHQVSAELKSPMWQGLLQLLADITGKKSTKVMHLVDESEIRFQVRDGRLYHEGQKIGFPEIDPELMITTSGSIGLDETLDLFVELPRLDPALRKELGPAKCHITGTITQPKISVKDGSLVLHPPDRKEPIIAAHGIKMDMQVETTAAGSVLVVEPVEVLKNAKLNLGVANGLMKFIAPDVDCEREVTGEVSLSLSKVRVPLGLPKDEAVKKLEVEGKLTLRKVSAELKSPMWQGLVQLLADMNGKKPPGAIHLIADSEIHFKVQGGRLHYDGQRIGFPEIDPTLVISSSGSIGVDETLDLSVELPRLGKVKSDKGPLQCRITGTILQPKIDIREASLVVQLTEGDKAALSVDNIDLSFSVEKSGDVRMLKLAPVTVFKKQKLTPEMGDELFHLISPSLSDLAGVKGEFSLSIDTFGVPLGVSKSDFVKKVVLTGKLQLHDVSLNLKTPLLQTLVKVLADLYGKKPSDVVRVIQNADVRFKVQDGKMYHEGLRFGFPDISPDLLVSSQGWVGYDKSLDLVLEVPRVIIDLKEPQTKKLDTVRYRVTGTIDNPIVTVIKTGKDK
jgi:hypothetical protein